MSPTLRHPHRHVLRARRARGRRGTPFEIEIRGKRVAATIVRAAVLDKRKP